MKRKIIGVMMLLAAAVSCTPDEKGTHNPSGNEAEMVMNITSDSFLGDWTEGDSVSILDNSGNHLFTASTSGSPSDFKGEAYIKALQRAALAPFTEDAVFKGDSVCFNFPSRQNGKTGNYAAAISNTKAFRMKSFNSILRLGFFSDDVKSIDIESLGEEPLAGKTTLIFNNRNGSFSIAGRDTGKGLSLVPESCKEYLDAGEYNLSCLPGEFKSGLKFTLHYDKMDAVYRISKTTEIEPCTVKDFGDIESGAEIEENKPFNICDVQLPGHDSAYEIEMTFIQTPSSTSFLWPFETPTSNEISSSWGEGISSFPAQKVRMILPDSKQGYSLEAFGTVGLTKNGGGSQGLRIGGKEGDYIAFPAIKGLFLTQVEWVSGTGNRSGAKILKTEDDSPVSGGEAIQGGTSSTGESFIWDLYGSEKETNYKISFLQSDSQNFQKLILRYDLNAPKDPSADFQEAAEDQIPDFSRVGYHYGDRDIPDVPVRMTISAPEDGSDALSLIQNAINSVQTPGAILLKEGTYNVSNSISLQRSGVVLRGEGEGRTIIKCTAETQVSRLIVMGTFDSRKLSSCSKIIARYVPVGQMWIPVAHPETFAAGDKVFIYRPATQEWLDDLHMSNLAELYPGNTNWTTDGYGMYWERQVTAIEGHKIYLDNPVVMCIGGDAKYGGGILYKGSWNRVEECGIEDLSLDTVYDASIKSGSDFVDENHCITGILVRSAENSWVRNVTGSHFYLSMVELGSGAKHVTVTDCTSLSPVSEVTGGRRYAFHFSNSQMCLVRNCKCDDDRHQFVCGARVSGPNVFLRCTATNTRSDAGPHQRWATGTLYDNVKVAGDLNIQDRAGWGTGHGWAGVNFVCYNCEAKRIAVQSPWVTGQNWAIGCIGTKISGTYTNFKDGLGPRPDGKWSDYGTHVTPESLYESQLGDRQAKGIYLGR